MKVPRRLCGALVGDRKTASRGKTAPTRRQDTGGRSREAERYRKAADDALTLVDWCIEYLADNHQAPIARRLALSRNRIAARLGD
jgi:hypothetical protein